MNYRKRIKAVTFSGLAIALIVVFLFIASIIDILDYTVSALCGLIVTFILVEFSAGYAISVYAGASILAILMVPNKINVILFIAFCGWYPFIKRYLEKAREPFGTLLKFAVFNASVIAIYFFMRKILLIEYTLTVVDIVLYLVCNVAFFIYDVLITKLIWLYVHKYRNKFFKQ